MFFKFFFYFLFEREICEVCWLIAVQLCHVIGRYFIFIIYVAKYKGLSAKKLGAKTCKIQGDFVQLQTSIANIPRTD